jgi:hypothetical protein
MDELTLELLLKHWKFLAVATLALFAAASLIVFTLPQNYAIRSIIEIGSFTEPPVGQRSTEPGAFRGRDRLEALEPPDQTVKAIKEFFLPDAIAALSESGAQPGADLQNFRAEAIGRKILVQSTAKASNRASSAEVQQRVIDRVLKDHAAIAQTLRDGLGIKINSQRRSLDELALGIKGIEDEANRLKKADQEAQARLATLREELAQRQQQAPGLRDAEEIAANEGAITSLYRQIDETSEHANNLNRAWTRAVLDRIPARSQSEILAESLTNNERTLETLKETRLILPPTATSTAPGPGRFYLLVVAMIASVLFSFAALLLFGRLASVHKKLGSVSPFIVGTRFSTSAK